MMRDIEHFPKKIVFVVTALWFCGDIDHVGGTSSPTSCTEVPENSTGVCCLCSNLDDCRENVTCPDGFQLHNLTSDICLQETSTEVPGATTSTEYTTQVSSTENVNEGQTAENVISNNAGNLCYKCGNDEYFDGKQCMSCHRLCLQCVGPSLEECRQCRYSYNGSCVSECPRDTVNKSVENSQAILCNSPSVHSKDDSGFPVAIVAGAVGGALVLIVVVIVVIILMRRRQPKGRSRMSTIILEWNEEAKPDNRQTTSKPTKKRRNYENQPDPGATFSRDIQEHGENIFRYTKDPTRKKTAEKSSTSTADDTDTYANAAMIRTHRTFQGKKVSQEKLQEELDKEEVKQLPVAPALPSAKKRISMAYKRFSKSIMKGKKSTQKQVEPEEQEYMDMNSASQLKQEVKEPRRKKEDQDNTGQEDYENVKFKLEPEETETEKEDYENISTLKRQKKPDTVDSEKTDMQESYEDMDFCAQKGQHSAGKVSTDTSAAKQGRDMNVEEEQTGMDIADDSVLEDYENSAVFKKKNTDRSRKVEKSSPYENVKF